MSIKVFRPFFDWIFSFLLLGYMSYLYSLEIKPKYYLSFHKLSFHFLIIFLAAQQLVSLIRSYLFIFIFISIALGGWSWKTWVHSCQRMFAYVLFWYFMVSCLIFKSLSHFELIIVYGERVCADFIGLQTVVQLSKHILLKRLSFFHYIFLCPLSKIIWL